MISYEPFWNTLKKNNISQYKLTNDFDVSKSLLQKLRDNESITLQTVQNLCNILNCNIDDIVIITPDKKYSKLEKS